MNVTARHFATGAEMIASAHAIRQRLMGNPAKQPAPKLKLVTIYHHRCEKPKDAHVEAFRQWQWDQARRATSVASYVRTRCQELSIAYEDVISDRRRKDIVYVRQLLIWEVSRRFSLSMPMIGRHFGGKDHTTVLHAIRRVEAKMARGEI